MPNVSAHQHVGLTAMLYMNGFIDIGAVLLRDGLRPLIVECHLMSMKAAFMSNLRLVRRSAQNR